MTPNHKIKRPKALKILRTGDQYSSVLAPKPSANRISLKVNIETPQEGHEIYRHISKNMTFYVEQKL
jgi:hypothetical protein